MQNVLVAGGAGFIGSHLLKELLTRGLKVVCIDNFITGSGSNIASFKNNPNFKFIEHNIIEELPPITDDIDSIFHLASPASPNKNSPRSYINFPIETLLTNSTGTLHLLELAKEKSARILYASTSEVYGNPTISPQREDYFGNVNPNGLRSVYDEGKRFGEALCMAYFRKYDMDIRIVRIFNTYGPNMQKDDGRVVSNFINQALQNELLTIYGDGTQTRSFCYADDMKKGLIKMMEEDNARGEVINLGNPEEYTIIEIANIIKRITGSSSEIIYKDLPEDDPVKRKPDIEKAKRVLGFTPEISLEEGLKKTIEYFRSV